MRKLKSWIDGYMQYTDNTESPVLFRKWSALSAVAAALQRKCYLEWGITETYPNLFIALVGPSGVGKGTAMKPSRDMLREIGVPVIAQRITPPALLREMKKAAIDHIDPKTNRIFMHSSVTVHSGELAVFLGYKNVDFIYILCDLYDCDERWENRTKDPTLTDEIIGPYLNIIGGITPASLQAVLPKEAIGGGLTSRMIMVYSDHESKIVPVPFLSASQRELLPKLISDLGDINQMYGTFKTTEGFISNFIDWYMDAKKNPPFTHPQFEGYLSRRPLQILKISMIMSASRSDEMLITEEDLKNAINLLNETEVDMPKALIGVGESRTASIVGNLMAYIGRYKKVSEAELNRIFYYEADRRTLTEALTQLKSMGYCDLVYEGSDLYVIYTNEKGDEK